jgi:hypothetical protein
MVAETQLRHSQRETQLVPETQLSALSQLSKTPSVKLSSSEDTDTDSSRRKFHEELHQRQSHETINL